MKIIVSAFLLILCWSGSAMGNHSHEALQIANAEHGESLYNTTCVACHGPNGKGVIPGMPDLRGDDSRLVQKDLSTLLHNVDEGFQSPGSMMAMPPKGGNASLSEQDIVDVLKYMREKFGSGK